MQRPTFIRMGSRMMAAISPGFSLKRRSTLPRLLKVAMVTLAMADLGTPNPPETGVGFSIVRRSRSVRLYADQSGVVQAVVGAFELNNLVAAGSGAGQAGWHAWWLPCHCYPKRHISTGKAIADSSASFPFHVYAACRTWFQWRAVFRTAFITAGWQLSGP